MRTGGRWWIAAIATELERPGQPIPEAFTPAVTIGPAQEAVATGREVLERLQMTHHEVVLFDTLTEAHLAVIGRLVWERALREIGPLVDVVVEVAEVRMPDELVGPAPEPEAICAIAGVADIATTIVEAARIVLSFMGRLRFKWGNPVVCTGSC